MVSDRSPEHGGCRALTKAGNPCRNRPTDGEEFCGRHVPWSCADLWDTAAVEVEHLLPGVVPPPTPAARQDPDDFVTENGPSDVGPTAPPPQSTGTSARRKVLRRFSAWCASSG